MDTEALSQLDGGSHLPRHDHHSSRTRHDRYVLTSSAETQQRDESFHEHAAAVAVVLGARFRGLLQLRAGPGDGLIAREVA